MRLSQKNNHIRVFVAVVALAMQCPVAKAGMSLEEQRELFIDIFARSIFSEDHCGYGVNRLKLAATYARLGLSETDPQLLNRVRDATAKIEQEFRSIPSTARLK